jgi:hypothetical protein
MTKSQNDWNQRLEADLAAIRAAISAGQTEEATKMLRGVSLNCKPGSTHSQEVGDLFMELGFPAMAGRFWYPLENKTDRMVAACNEFEDSLCYCPTLIIEALGWHPNPSPFVKARLVELHQQAKDFQREYLYDMKPPKGLRDRVALLGCAIVGFVLMFVFIQGIWFISTWFR